MEMQLETMEVVNAAVKQNTFVIEDTFLNAVLAQHKFVKSIDELETIMLNWSEKEGKLDGYILAKALIDGLWAWQRSVDYSAKTKAKVAQADQMVADKARKEARLNTFNKLIAAKPELATKDEHRLEYLNLQRQYDVIDHATYQVLVEAHNKMAALIAAAVKEATEKVKKAA